jgi:DNA-binding NarL/FixJ family response regulator
MNLNINIIVVETSPLVSEGLAALLNKSALKCQFSFIDTLGELELAYAKRKSEIVVINPSLVQNNLKSFNSIRNRLINVRWIGLVYAWHDPELLSVFDAVITISDTFDSAANKITRLISDENQQGHSSSQDTLSEREIDVLKLLASGLANKEIADKLNISINTVMSHRKNISQKTGIKSVSGLTIYAVVQKHVSIESLSE